MPSLQQLLLLATSRQGTKQLPGSSSCDAVEQTPLNMLEQTSAFASNASVASMAESMGLSALTTSLAGTLMTCPTQPRDTSTTFAAAATGGPSNPCGSRQVQHQAPAHTGSALENSLTAAAEVAKAMVWRQVDNAWAVEAVKRGVAYAKSGG